MHAGERFTWIVVLFLVCWQLCDECERKTVVYVISHVLGQWYLSISVFKLKCSYTWICIESCNGSRLLRIEPTLHCTKVLHVRVLVYLNDHRKKEQADARATKQSLLRLRAQQHLERHSTSHMSLKLSSSKARSIAALALSESNPVAVKALKQRRKLDDINRDGMVHSSSCSALYTMPHEVRDISFLYEVWLMCVTFWWVWWRLVQVLPNWYGCWVTGIWLNAFENWVCIDKAHYFMYSFARCLNICVSLKRSKPYSTYSTSHCSKVLHIIITPCLPADSCGDSYHAAPGS